MTVLICQDCRNIILYETNPVLNVIYKCDKCGAEYSLRIVRRGNEGEWLDYV